ncbi:MAG: hypothetical protein ABFC97_03310 [Anaerolineaceae bacterium]
MSEDSTGKKNSNHFVILYAAIFVAAIGLRFALLGSSMLDDTQADLALQALNLSKGNEVTLSGEPGYLVLTTLQFFIFGTSNFMARFWPALFGSLLVLVPWLYRDRLGKTPALFVTALMALDPILIGSSRTAIGISLAVSGLLAGLGFWRQKRWLPAGICLGAAMLGGVEFWQGLLGIILLLVLMRMISPANPASNPNPFSLDSGWLVMPGSALITWLVLGTLFFTIPSGISAFGNSLVAYFSSLLGSSRYSTSSLSLAGLIIELPIVVVAIWSLVEGFVRGDKTRKILGLWWGLMLVLALLEPGNGLISFSWVSLPMSVLAALQLTAFFSHLQVENRWVLVSEVALLIAMILFSFLNLFSLVNNDFLTAEDSRNRIIGTLLPILLLIAITVLFAWGWSADSARKGFVLGFLILLGAGLLANSWKAAGLGSRPQQEIITASPAVVGQKELMSTVEELSRWKTGTASGIDLQIAALDLPSLQWALRDYPNLVTTEIFFPSLESSIVLTPISLNIQSQTSYRGQAVSWTSQPILEGITVKEFMKWVLFRSAPTQDTQFLLWARNDLFPGAVLP